MKRRFPIHSLIVPVLLVAGGILAAVLLGNVVSFFSTRANLPAGTLMGGVDVGGLNLDDAVSRTITTLQAPVALRYQSTVIQLQPTDVDFQVNDVVARLQLQQVIDSQRSVSNLPAYILRRVTETRLAAPYQYSDTKLDAFLTDIAKEYDVAPQKSSSSTTTLQLARGQDGMSLNLQDARSLVLNALASAAPRIVDLPVDTQPGGANSIQALGDLIKQRVAAYNSNGMVAGVFVKDLRTGKEFSLHGDVAFSAQGWLKLAIVLEAYHALSGTLSSQTAQQLASIVSTGSNGDANEVLKTIGGGDAPAGVNLLNDFLKRMGLVSTFLAQPFDQSGMPTQFITPGNTRTDINASPDPNAQSTPVEIGILLQMLEQCRVGGGALPLIFPGEFPAAQCEQILAMMSQNNANVLIAANSNGATVIHRQSWDANNHGDAALVRSPGGTYILVVMLHGNGLNWADTSQVIGDVARATYGFFNQGQIPPSVAAMNTAPTP